MLESNGICDVLDYTGTVPAEQGISNVFNIRIKSITVIEKREVPTKYSPIKHLWNFMTSIAYLDEYRVFIATNVGLFINQNTSDSDGYYKLQARHVIVIYSSFR